MTTSLTQRQRSVRKVRDVLMESDIRMSRILIASSNGGEREARKYLKEIGRAGFEIGLIINKAKKNPLTLA